MTTHEYVAAEDEMAQKRRRKFSSCLKGLSERQQDNLFEQALESASSFHRKQYPSEKFVFFIAFVEFQNTYPERLQREIDLLTKQKGLTSQAGDFVSIANTFRCFLLKVWSVANARNMANHRTSSATFKQPFMQNQHEPAGIETTIG